MSYASAVLALSPIAYWRLGEASGTSAADATGNGHTGTYAGSPTLGVTGLLSGDSDTAVTFAAGKYVSLPPQVAYQVSTITVVAWVKATAPNDFQMLTSHADGSVSNAWFLAWRSTGKVNFTVVRSGDHAAETTATYNDGARHMVVGRYDGTNIDIFVDGTRVQRVAYAGGMNDGAGIGAAIGAEYGGSFTGPQTLDEVAWFGSALADADIANLWTIGTAGNGANGSLTLGGTVGAGARAGGAGSLTLGGGVNPPLSATGHLDLGSPAVTPTPVYLASFTVDAGMELSDIPLLPADTPTVDYVGDDASDLVSYPDPTLDEWGRPIAS